ncbi:MAG TPA: ATP-binding protein [Longimicrobiales bacterium]
MADRTQPLDRAPHVPRPGIASPHSELHASHLCLIGADPDTTLAEAVLFLRRGLDRGERAVFVVDGRWRSAVERALAGVGIDIAAEVARGALLLVDAADVVMCGDSSAEAVAERCRDHLRAADRFTATRVAVDPGWASAQAVSSERLLAWEARVSSVLEATPRATALCLYDRTRFPPEMLDRVLGHHPALIAGGRVFTNPYFEPRSAGAPGDAAARLSWKLDRIRRLREVEEDRGRLVERACRHEVTWGASHRVEATLERMRQLRDITAGISSALTGQEVIAALAERVMEVLAARAVSVVDAPSAGDSPALVHTLGWPSDAALEYGRLPIAEASLSAAAMRAREPVFLATLAEYAARYPHLERFRRLLGPGSTAAIPLIGKNRVLGAFELAFGEVRTYTEEDHGFATTLGHVAGQAIERARVHEAVRASEERFRVAQELSVDGFAILRSLRNEVGEIEDFVWEYANPAVGRIVRRDPAEFAGRRMLELFSGRPDWELHDRLVQVVETGTPLEFERFYDAGQLHGWYRITAVRLGDGVAISFTDIMDRKRAEEQARLNAVRSRVLAEVSRAFAEAPLQGAAVLDKLAECLAVHVRDACAILLASGDGDRFEIAAVRHADAAVTRFLQQRIAVPSTVECALAAGAVRAGRTVVIDEPDSGRLASTLAPELLAYVARDGVRGILAVPLIVGREAAGAILLVRGRSSPPYGDPDRQLAEEIADRARFAIDNARLYHEAQEAIRTRDEVHRIVAHDLRSPLNTISMAVRLLQDRIVDGGEARKYIDVIRRSTSHMARLTEDLLDVARIEAGALAIEVDRVDPGPLVAEAVEMYRSLAAERSLDLLAGPTDDAPPILVDRGRVLQVFANLLDNAIKFTSPGGAIRVYVERREDALAFCVSDTGPGVPPDQVRHVFDRFWQTSRARRAGAGLGLAIAKGIVEAHGGCIGCESEPGRGSTFWFAVPIA